MTVVTGALVPLADVPRHAVAPGLRVAMRAFRRKAPFRRAPGGHRPRLLVFASLYENVIQCRAGAPGWVDNVSHWRVIVWCRCGMRVSRSMAHGDNPGLTFRRVLDALREEVRGPGCGEALRLLRVAAVMDA